MITIAGLRQKVLSFLQQADDSAFTVSGIDLIVDAMKKSHQRAQMFHDFEFAKGNQAAYTLTIAGGGVLSPALQYGTLLPILVKKIIAVMMTDPLGTGALRPINFTAESSRIEDLRERWKGLIWATDTRYPAYPIPMQGSFPPWVVQMGKTLQLYPTDCGVWGSAGNTSPINLVMDIVQHVPCPLYDPINGNVSNTLTGQLEDTTQTFITLGVNVGDTVVNNTTGKSTQVLVVTSQTVLTLLDSTVVMTTANTYSLIAQPSFLFEYGDLWLFWDIICQLNPMIKEFVPRQEGNVAEPDQQRETEWANLMTWDSALVGTGTTAYNLD